MINQRRSIVVWVGASVPANVASVLDLLGLNPVAMNLDDIEPERLNPFAVLLPLDPALGDKFRGNLARLLVPTLDCGAMLAIVAAPGVAHELAVKHSMERAAEIQPKVHELNNIFPNLRIVSPDPRDIAHTLREHDAGFSVDQQMSLHGFDPGPPSAGSSAEVLLRRAFNGFHRLNMKELRGGRSLGSRVWQVDAYKENHCCEPFVVKMSRHRALKEELRTWQELVLDYMPFPFRSPPVPERFVIGATRAVLVSMLASRASRFDEYVAVIKSPELAISSLFDGALRNWRRRHRVVNQSLGMRYVKECHEAIQNRDRDEEAGRVPKSILPDPGRLLEAYNLARQHSSDVPVPEALYQMLSDLPAMQFRDCRSHGDLNARNLLVRWNGLDVILIDFSHAGGDAPMSRDPSRLEVSLAFDVADGKGQLLTDEVLRAMYKSPLLPPHDFPQHDDGRIEAVRHLRLHVTGEGVHAIEYDVTTACHLLRYARGGATTASDISKQEEQRMRGLSYCLAAELVMAQSV